ncbi:hypothetical protein [Reyranella sp.]|uniref:hypothetical protein n=1 Tax=Reyranella sp. TaxID=1929291 RepID=UPI003BAD4B08
MAAHAWKAVLALAISLTGGTAAGQTCPVGLGGLPAGWSEVPVTIRSTTPILGAGRQLRCDGCTPQVTAIIAAGPRPGAFPKTGLAWAQEGATAPQARAQLLSGILSAVRARSPECIVTGELDGVSTTSALAFITATTSLRCLPEQSEATQLSYVAYDGRCLYDVVFAWKGPAALANHVRGRAHDLLNRLEPGSRSP